MPPSRFPPPRDLALGAALFFGSAAAGLTPVADGDVYWHMAAGREIVRRGAFLYADPFSISAHGRPWLDVHWLFQLVVYGLHQVGGLGALVFAKCACIGAAALCSFAALGRRQRALFVPMCVAALFFARHLLLVRPVIVTLLFLSFFLWRLERDRRAYFRSADAQRMLWQLPLAQIVWSNCQGLFALGPAVLAAYTAGAAYSALRGGSAPFRPESVVRSPQAQLRGLLNTLLGCLAAAFATPYGARALALPIKLLLRLTPSEDNPYQNVAENLPPFLVERLSPEQFWHFKWVLALLALTFVVSRGRSTLSHLLLTLGFAGLALISNRNVLLFYWIAAPIAAVQLTPALRLGLRSLARRPALLAPARWLPHLVLLGMMFAVGTAAARETSLREPSPFHVPVDAVQVITQLSGPEHGTLFSADHQGGYVIWKLYPRFKPYIDTRLVLRTEDQYREYLELAEQPKRFDAFQRRHGFTYVILPVAYPDRYLRLIAHLHASADWTLIHTDGSDVVFAFREAAGAARVDLGDAATTDRLLQRLQARYAGDARLLASGRIQLATLDVAVGAYAQAERILSDMPSPAARTLQARSRLLQGDLDGAEEIAEKLLHDDASDVASLDVLAMTYVRRGRFSYALTFLRRALAIDPFDSEATRLLGELEEVQHVR